ncbi:adenosylmethionine--8-amino-7-oxononanoate transaminase [Allomuricauda sp. SCSIO 65647]|uniref:adenosylmethionine--8-amino-7-oxononanoate transaminase n=1 Tax=Allomuricauda sp. SCSIO 65647 TaxID=2908843 RepID=UPI001F249D87|nr:adenosylmethionine--8-amino-7-oxononanoate transaminase [Muricauda sp. SCSIO 65647]UJH66123.1 adenosylmethionine--8-amino-7-oxononanoate transaminase [Muricauda sp. SCSIO 65647]
MHTTTKSLTERDQNHLWHPLTQHKLHPEMLGIVKAKGALLYDESGKEYIDGIASWYTTMYGHCNEYILSMVGRQMQQLDQVVFSGFTHLPAIELSEALINILPDNQQKLFFSDNGSTSVEVAVKMALQYHFNKGHKKNVLLAFEEGFHGDTFGAMSVSGLSVYNGPFEDFFLEVKRIPVPEGKNIEKILQELENLLGEDNTAAFVYEPLVQGAAAMKMHDAHGLDQILALLKKYGVLLIADEVMTGFGKTGTYFASDQIETKPDIICLSKALTAGLVPMGLTTCTQEVYDAFLDDDIAKGFFHGHTYSANPLACTVALAGIELLRSEKIQRNITNIMKWHGVFAEEIKEHPKVKNVRRLGVIFALDLTVDMQRYGNLRDKLFNHFMNEGVFLRPLGNTIYVLPPYVITREQMEKVYASIRSAIALF